MKRTDLKDIQDSGFIVPKDYFENFENSIMSHTNLKEKVSDSGFAIPKEYFDSVEDKILTSTTQKESVKVISLINRKSLIYISSIAAALVLMFNLIDSNSGLDFKSIETTSIESYLSNEDIYSEELADLFNDTEFLNDSFNTISFSEEAMEDYVNDNIEFNDLYFE